MSIASALLPFLLALGTTTIAITYLRGCCNEAITKVVHWRAQTSFEWIAVVLYGGFVTFVIGQLCLIIEEATLAKGETYWIPDIQPPYSPTELHDLMRGFGPDGRRLYIGVELWDIFVYGQNYPLLWSSALQWASGKQIVTRLSMLPWLVWVFDQLENSAQTYCTLTFDEGGPNVLWTVVAVFGNMANVTKWLGFAIFVAMFLCLAARRLFGLGEVQQEESSKKA